MFYRLLFLTVFLSGCQWFQLKPASDQVPIEEPSAATATIPKQECPAPAEPKPCPVCAICPITKPIKPIPLAVNDPIVVGAIERVKLSPPGITLTARIDTGAKSSSLHALNIVKFEREGKRWVSFDAPNGNGELINLKLPVERRVRITQANDDMQRRYVVKMWLTLGGIREKVDITLTDRSELDHPLLVGRSLLMDTAIVDVSRKFTQK